MKAVPVKTLAELVDSGVIQLTRGKIISKTDMAACPGHFPVYSSAKDNDGKFGEYGQFLFDEELITWSVDGGGRLFHRPKHKFSVTNVGGVLRIRDRSVLDYRYLYYVLSLRHSEVSFDWVRKAHPSIIKKLYQNIPVPLLTEQERIVGVLDEAFDGLAIAKANAEKNLQNARALFESHLQSVFTERGAEWAQKPLAELCDIKHGFTFKSEFFTTDGNYVLLTPGNFYESGGYRDRGEKQKYYSGPIPPNFILAKGDMLVAMTEQAAGLLGSPIIVPESDKFLHNQRLGLVTKKPGVPWTNEFFFYIFNTQAVRKEIHDSASGVKVRHTSPTKIGQVIVSFPTSLSEQRAIVSTLKDLREETQRLEPIYQRKLAALDELKKSLLEKAFAGELTVQPRKSVVLPFPTTIPNITTTDLHAGILAIAYQLHEKNGKQSYFGHVKAEKIAHMIEAHLGIDLERNPIKDVAGPNDYPHLKRVEHRAKKAGFFLFQESEGAGYRVTKYRGFNALIDRTRSALGNRNKEIDALLELTLPMNTKQAEIFATVYAAWNNLLFDKQLITDEAIVFEARENWHPDKLKIKRKRFFDAIRWMREKGVIPTGNGKRVNSKVKKKK